MKIISINLKPEGKPRVRFCWSCGRKLYGNQHAIVTFEDETDRILHIECAKNMQSSIKNGDDWEFDRVVADEVKEINHKSEQEEIMDLYYDRIIEDNN